MSGRESRNPRAALRRLRGAGDLSRWIAIPFAAVIFLSSLRYLSLGPSAEQGADAWSPLSVSLAIAFDLAAAYALVRASMLGVWAGRDSLVIRSWFATWRLLRASVTAVEVTAYWGAISVSDDPLLRMPVIRRVDGRDVVARGIVAGQRVSKRHALALRAWLATGELPEPESAVFLPRQPRH